MRVQLLGVTRTHGPRDVQAEKVALHAKLITRTAGVRGKSAAPFFIRASRRSVQWRPIITEEVFWNRNTRTKTFPLPEASATGSIGFQYKDGFLDVMPGERFVDETKPIISGELSFILGKVCMVWNVDSYVWNIVWNGQMVEVWLFGSLCGVMFFIYCTTNTLARVNDAPLCSSAMGFVMYENTAI